MNINDKRKLEEISEQLFHLWFMFDEILVKERRKRVRKELNKKYTKDFSKRKKVGEKK